ncbi:DeoR family transcriptional regulator [Salinithrix halophila]|uniref:DeoR family transcriptional regulator n=1 Tax=Salinithrix halophila TaxID=1485204 RepID=A0ABV8JCG3_9BACL
MLPHERQQRIREWIQKRTQLKISEISKDLKVSEMTVYRDIRPLLQEGLIHKVYGGIALSRGETASPSPAPQGCILCSRQVDPRLAYRIILPGNQVETACCSHCGLLRHSQLNETSLQAVCQDFFSNTTISAQTAWYVMGCELDIRCCQPQVLNFERWEVAGKFVKGFGGDVLSFTEALRRIGEEMNPTGSCGCASKE